VPRFVRIGQKLKAANCKKFDDTHPDKQTSSTL